VPAAPVYQYSTLTADAQLRLLTAMIPEGRIATHSATHLPDLEHRVAERLGRTAAVAVDSGSAALALAVRALHLGPEHEVIIPEAGWVSVGAAANSTGASVRVAPVTEHLAPGWEQIAELITGRTGAVILAHLRGRSAPDTELIALELAERGIPLIEDCAQAWAVTAHGRPAGARGLIATLSVQYFKLIAVGEGGLLVADDPDLLSYVRAVAGDTRQPTPTAVWRGKNRMTEASAALALPQLAYLDALTANLRAQQLAILDALVPVPGISSLLPPTATDVASGNGSLTGLWLPRPAIAEHLADTLYRRGYRAWWPGPGDLHTADAWPTQPAARIVDLRRYLDIQTPWLPPDEHASFAAILADTVRAALKEASAR
jgi:dTDP-4-amino-4,6-dideoxygalactose transaminase